MPTTGRGAPGQEFRALETRAWLREDGPDGGAPAAGIDAGGWWRLLGPRTEPAPTQDLGRREVEDSRVTSVAEWALTKRE